MLKTLFGRAFMAIAALAFAAGCAGNPSPITPLQDSSRMRVISPMTRLLVGPAAAGPVAVPLVPPPVGGPRGWPVRIRNGTTQPILFVADLQNSVVRLYDPTTPNPSPEGSITQGISNPSGLAVDANGSLYVSNIGSSAITVYSPGKTKPRLSIPTSGYYGIAVDSKGDIFATSVAGTVYAYRRGMKKPYEKIGGFVNPVGIAVDGKDNVWVSDDTASKVYTIAAGTKQVKDAGLKGLDHRSDFVLEARTFSTFPTSRTAVRHSWRSTPTVRSHVVQDTSGIASPTLSGLTASGIFFQSNQTDNVVGYKKGQKTPFSTITGLADPLGIASYPLVKK